jgi:hypothetical protein
MENMIEVEVQDMLTGEVIKHIIIDRGNGEFTSMLKSTYDAMQAAQSTPSIPEGGN